MSMIKCPECGKDMSDKATVCPDCGYPILEAKKALKKEKLMKLKKKSLLIIPVIVIIVICTVFIKNVRKTGAIIGEWELIGVSTGKNKNEDANLLTIDDFNKLNISISGKFIATKDKNFKMELEGGSLDEGTWEIYNAEKNEETGEVYLYSLSGKVSYLAIIGKSDINRIYVNIVSDDSSDLTFIYEKK